MYVQRLALAPCVRRIISRLLTAWLGTWRKCSVGKPSANQRRHPRVHQSQGGSLRNGLRKVAHQLESDRDACVSEELNSRAVTHLVQDADAVVAAPGA